MRLCSNASSNQQKPQKKRKIHIKKADPKDENKCFHIFCLFNLIVKILKYSNSLADNQFSVVNHHQNKKTTKIIKKYNPNPA